MSWSAPRKDPRCFKNGETLQLALATIVPGRAHPDFVELMRGSVLNRRWRAARAAYFSLASLFSFIAFTAECHDFTKTLHGLKPKIAASGLAFMHLDPPDFADASLWPPTYILRPHSDALCRAWLIDDSAALAETSKIITLEQLVVELKLS